MQQLTDQQADGQAGHTLAVKGLHKGGAGGGREQRVQTEGLTAPET
jgi:hypothetical protein